MKIDIITLFPEMFRGPFDESIIKRAQEKGLVEINIHDLRKWTTDKHKTVDDHPYGGGVGMIIRVDVIARAIEEIKSHHPQPTTRPTTHNSTHLTILLDPGGTPFNQLKAQELAKSEHLILIAGHYEGVDERVKEYLVNEEISIGDYVLTGGELPTMVVVDSIVRLIPGVLEKPAATQFESFSNPTSDIRHPKSGLEYPQYTRPEEFKGWKVPEVLLSGNHREIEKWRKEQSIKKTKNRRPDLLK